MENRQNIKSDKKGTDSPKENPQNNNIEERKSYLSVCVGNKSFKTPEPNPSLPKTVNKKTKTTKRIPQEERDKTDKNIRDNFLKEKEEWEKEKMNLQSQLINLEKDFWGK